MRTILWTEAVEMSLSGEFLQFGTCPSAADPAHECPNGKQRVKIIISQSGITSIKKMFATGVEIPHWQENEEKGKVVRSEISGVHGSLAPAFK